MDGEVLPEMDEEPFYLDISGRRYAIDSTFLEKHPGGKVILTYKNRDATNVFNAFHDGSAKPYKWLKALKSEQIPSNPDPPDSEDERKNTEILQNFDSFRQQMKDSGLFDVSRAFFAWKLIECVAMIGLSFLLQYFGFYTVSALILGLAWQQSGWISHDFGHHQPTNDRARNRKVGYLVGNVIQGFSAGWWTDKHNIHHAATNIIGKDVDIDFAPIFALKGEDLPQTTGHPWSTIIPYQHIYFWFALPLLRFSWISQSVSFIISTRSSPFLAYRKEFRLEAITMLVHFAWVFAQLSVLPDLGAMVQFFLVSQLFGGMLTSYVVAYNHTSMAKFSTENALHDNFPALQLYTTRNMRPSALTDWLWGGLNYQIEHHLFPTLPRHNLPLAAPLVRKFAADNDLPYQVDDYLTGCRHNLKLVAQMAARALEFHRKGA